MGEPPVLNRRIVESLLGMELPRARAAGCRLVLVHGRFHDPDAAESTDRAGGSGGVDRAGRGGGVESVGGTGRVGDASQGGGADRADGTDRAERTDRGGRGVEFSVRVDGRARRVRVSDQQSVLGIVAAWQSHLAADPDGDGVLVVTTGVDDGELGWDLRGHALGRATRTVDPVEILGQRFGATDVDPRIRAEPWLVTALLDAEPPAGWRRVGAVLTRDAALRALVGARLGGFTGSSESGGSGAGEGGTPDIDALLGWSRTAAGPARFAALPPAERAGLTGWLTETVGEAAPVLLDLAAAGRAADAMALGVVGAVLDAPASGRSQSTEAAFVFGGLLGAVRHDRSALRAFTHAVEATLERWITQAAGSGGTGGTGGTVGSLGDEARQRVREVLDRADEIAAAAGLTEALAGNRFLRSGLRARLRTLADALTRALTRAASARSYGTSSYRSGVTDSAVNQPEPMVEAEAALCAVHQHRLARLYPEHPRVAEMAVRLLRWLSGPDGPGSADAVASGEVVDSVAGGVRTHLADWGWVDRASAALWAGDPTDDPVVARAYRELFDAVRARREILDGAFAGRLTVWAEGAAAPAPGGCLLVEDVLATVAVPLASVRSPLIVVADGMSSAVAVELGELLAGWPWIEVSAHAGQRSAAVSAIPSVTRISRASLLTGRFTTGDQQVERDGFAAFWRRHRRSAALFHKGEIGGEAGRRLAEPLLAAIAGDGVVGVVLNTIDDALDHGREGGRAGWTPADVGYLPELLDAALSAGRPVLLVSDHGHVLERGPAGQRPQDVPGAQSARWRLAGAVGENGVTGPLAGNGEVAVAGPRVGHGGEVIVPWREDIRYTSRRSGYHGGASLAEMTVPVLVFMPPPTEPAVGRSVALPTGWSVLSPEATTPSWWRQPRPDERPDQTDQPDQTGQPDPADRFGRAVSTGRKSGRTRTARSAPAAEGLFPEPVVAPPPAPPAPAAPPVVAPVSLGARVVASEVYATQRRFVRRAPDPDTVAAVIDTLAGADGPLSLAAVAAAGGRAGRSPEGFAATLERLLNVEGYPVLSIQDGGRAMRLNSDLLREQFALDPEPPR